MGDCDELDPVALSRYVSVSMGGWEWVDLRYLGVWVNPAWILSAWAVGRWTGKRWKLAGALLLVGLAGLSLAVGVERQAAERRARNEERQIRALDLEGRARVLSQEIFDWMLQHKDDVPKPVEDPRSHTIVKWTGRYATDDLLRNFAGGRLVDEYREVFDSRVHQLLDVFVAAGLQKKARPGLRPFPDPVTSLFEVGLVAMHVHDLSEPAPMSLKDDLPHGGNGK